jgi:hypothetical protein
MHCAARWELITQKIPYSDEKLRSGPAGLAQLYSHVVEEKKRLQALSPHCLIVRSVLGFVWRPRAGRVCVCVCGPTSLT